MKQRKQGNLICSRQWTKTLRYYVQSVPGDGGKDWGYTTAPEQALALNSYFARRFAADCKRCGSVALMYPLA